MITTDTVVSMNSGLVLSHIFNHVKDDEHERPLRKYWGQYISEKHGWKIKLLRLPNFGELSVRELTLLKEIYEKFSPLGMKLIAYHHRLPEYIPTRRSSIPVSVERILEKLGKSVEEIEASSEDAAIQNCHRQISVRA
jgi:hypothetical protein